MESADRVDLVSAGDSLRVGLREADVAHFPLLAQPEHGLVAPVLHKPVQGLQAADAVSQQHVDMVALQAAQASQSRLPMTISALVPMSMNRVSRSSRYMPDPMTPATISPPT